MYDLDFFFLQLQQLMGTRLYEKESVIIFDEVQLFPKARQAIKYLVSDGRYKYIETGSLLSIKKNTKDILIPSEEHKISMFPMDFEEFLWAIGDEVSAETIRHLIKNKKAAGNALPFQCFPPRGESALAFGLAFSCPVRVLCHHIPRTIFLVLISWHLRPSFLFRRTVH